MKQAIGFIDSGVGGLTVVKEALKQMPNESIIYLGDNARCPYGPRPKEQVLEFTWQMTNFLLKQDIKLLVIACNTATAVALDEIRSQVDIPVVGVVFPGVRAAIKNSKNGKIGVIGTKGTIESEIYERLLLDKNHQLQLSSLACPDFVPLVESNEYTSSIAKKVVAKRLQPLANKKLDTLILGCTHYPLLRPIIQNVMGQDVTLIDSGAEAISEVSSILDYFHLAESSSSLQETPNTYEFYTTGSAKMFETIARGWIDLPEMQVKKISLE